MNCACPPSRCGWHDEATRHAVGGRRAPVAADEMQAQIDAGGAARCREEVAAVDVEHVRHHLDPGIGARKSLGVAPVRRRLCAVEKARGREHEHARAERQQPRTARMGAAQRADESGRHRRVRTAPARHDDGARPLDEREPAVGLDTDAAQPRAAARARCRRPRSGTSRGPSPAGRGRRSRRPRRTRRCTARRRRAPPRAGSAAAAVSFCVLARSSRSVGIRATCRREAGLVSNRATLRGRRCAASFDRRAAHAEPCHRHAARAPVRGGRALRAQAELGDRLLGRAREPEGRPAGFRPARRARRGRPTPRGTCPVPSACRTARSRPSA